MLGRPVLLASLAAAASLRAQTPREAPRDPGGWALERWTTAHGLPQNVVVGLAQDNDGYLWVATPRGVVRFDGARFVAARELAARGGDAGPVRGLLTAPDGVPWVVHRLAAPRPVAPRTHHLAPPPPPVPVQRGALLAGDTIVVEGADRAWRAVAARAWQPIDLGHGITGETRALARAPDDALWLLGGAGVARRAGDRVDGWSRARLAGRDTLWSIAPARDGGAWVGTSAGLVRIARDGRTQAVHADRAIVRGVTAVVATDADSLWVLAGAQVLRLGVDTTAAGQRRARVAAAIALPVGAAGRATLLVDDAARLWVGTEAAGLFAVRPLAVGRIALAGARRGEVHAMLGDGAGGLWIVGGCVGLAHRDTVGHVSYHLPPSLGLRTPCVQSLARDSAGGLWIGQRGALSHVGGDGHVDSLVLDRRAADVDVGPLHVGRDGTLWIALADGHLLRRAVSGRVDTVRAAGVDGRRTWALQTRGDSLLVAQPGRQSWLHGDRVVRRVTIPAAPPRALVADPDGAFWIGSYGGGVTHVDRGGRVSTLRERDGFFDDGISAVVRDRGDRLWLLGDRALAVVPRAELRDAMRARRAPVGLVAYGPADSMPEGNGGFPNAWLDPRDRLWLATIAGLARVDAGVALRRRASPRPRIEAVSVDDSLVDGAHDAIVPAGGHALALAFTAPSLDGAHRVRFRYRLEGHDRDWVRDDGGRLARYARLAPGRYRFVVEVAATGEGFVAPAATLGVTVVPAWHERTAARVAGLVLAVGFAGAWGYRAVRRAEARARALQRELAERARLEAEAERAARELAHASRLATAGELAASVAHEINQPLHAVVMNAQAARRMHVVGATGELAATLDDVVEQAERAASVVAAMRGFVRKTAPVVEPVALVPLVQRAARLVAGECARRGASIALELPVPATVRGDALQLEQVLVNLLLNAADAVREVADTRRVIVVALARAGDDVRVEVRDRGAGLAATVRDRLFEPFVTTRPQGLGLGLAICRTIVEAHGGRIAVHSDAASGTRVVIDLPAAVAQ